LLSGDAALSLEDKIREDIHARIQQRMESKVRGRGMPAGVLPGLILIAIGTLFLLDHMDIIHMGSLWKFWPLILIALGLSKLLVEHNRVGGVILILVGAYFQLNHLGILNLSWNTFWPVLLIVGGILMISSRFELGRFRTAYTSPTGQEVLNEFALFGGVERRINVSNFKGGRVEAVFGGIEVDLRSAEIEGEEAIVEVEALFGGIEFTVPDRWIIIYQGQSIFGGYSDETRQPTPDVSGAPRKTLILRGRALFGGIVVKN
jgi:predicted membrane protein